MIPTIGHSRKGKTIEKEKTKEIRCFQGLGWGIDKQAEHRGFLEHENTLYDSIMEDTCHYKFVQAHRKYNIQECTLM